MSQKRHSIHPEQMDLALELMDQVSEAYLALPTTDDLNSQEFMKWSNGVTKATESLMSAHSSDTLSRLFRHNLNNHFTTISLAFEFLKIGKTFYCKSVEDFRQLVRSRVKHVTYELQSLDFWVKGRGLPRVEKVDLAEFMGELAPILLNVASERGMEMGIEVPQRELLVWLHRGTIASLLINQGKNAKVHGGAQNIILGVAEEGNLAKLLFADDGKGVPHEHLPYIFDFGYSSRRNGSSGLGLANADVRMRDMGGSLLCDPNGGINGGALFEMAVRKA